MRAVDSRRHSHALVPNNGNLLLSVGGSCMHCHQNNIAHSVRNYHPHSHTVTLRHHTHTQSIDAINNLLPVTVVSRELRLTSYLCKKEWYQERKMMVQK